MPRKNRRRKPRTKGQDKSFQVEKFGIPPEHHAEFKAKAIEAAKASVEKFPELVEKLKAIFRVAYPPQTLACFASYAFRQYVGKDGVEPANSHNNVQQHHGEFLQAVILTLPIEEWGHDPVTPDVIQQVFDLLPELSVAFLSQGIVSTPDDLSKEEITVRGIQQRVRLHTQGVRNWGYFQDVVQITRELIGPLNAKFEIYYGFSGHQVIDTLLAMVEEHERIQNEHFKNLRKISRGKNYRQVFRLYFKYVEGLKGDADDMINYVPADFPKENALAMVMSHYDLRLSDELVISASNISEKAKLDQALCHKILSRLSFDPGALKDQKPEFFFLGNPTWERPGIRIGEDSFLFAMPQMSFSHITRIVENMADEAGIKVALEDRRSEFLEEKLESHIKKSLPGATIKSNVKWKLGADQYETDLLVLQDRVLLIAEAKSHRLTPEGLRGAPKRVKRHIDDLVLAPSVQSERLEKLVLQAKDGDKEANKTVSALGIDPNVVDHVIRFSVTLDDLSVLSAAEEDFKQIGWIPKDHQLAPTILISDFGCIVEILDNPLLLYHYLHERFHLQKTFDILGDELDFLGLYLSSGFNLYGLSQQDMQFVTTGMSAPIDRYFESKSVGENVRKPEVLLGKYVNSTIQWLADRRPKGWTTAGMHLLSCGDPDEQKQLDKAITKVKSIVRKDYRKSDHICSVHVQPPEQRKARVILHFFPKELSKSWREVSENLMESAMEDPSLSTCVAISHNIDDRKSPYHGFGLVVREPQALLVSKR